MKKIFTILSFAAVSLLSAQTNLVQNPGFESGLAPWAAGTTSGYTTPSLVTNDSHSGSNSAGYNSPGDTTGFYQNVPVTGGETYTISFWYRTSGSSNSLARLWSVYKNSSNAAVYTTADASTDPFRTNNKYLSTDNDTWVQYTASMPAPAVATSLDVAVRVYKAATKAYFDDFVVVQGTLAVTDPKDFDKQVQMNTIVDNELTLRLPERSTVNIYSVDGKLISSNRVSDGGSVNTATLVKGGYIVTVDNGSAKISRKIIKK